MKVGDLFIWVPKIFAVQGELAYLPTENTQTTGGGGNLQVPASVVPSFATPAFAPNHAELYGARRSAQTSSDSEGGSEDDMRVDSPENKPGCVTPRLDMRIPTPHDRHNIRHMRTWTGVRSGLMRRCVWSVRWKWVSGRSSLYARSMVCTFNRG